MICGQQMTDPDVAMKMKDTGTEYWWVRRLPLVSGASLTLALLAAAMAVPKFLALHVRFNGKTVPAAELSQALEPIVLRAAFSAVMMFVAISAVAVWMVCKFRSKQSLWKPYGGG